MGRVVGLHLEPFPLSQGNPQIRVTGGAPVLCNCLIPCRRSQKQKSSKKLNCRDSAIVVVVTVVVVIEQQNFSS